MAYQGGFGNQEMAHAGMADYAAIYADDAAKASFLRKTYGWFLFAVGISVATAVPMFLVAKANFDAIAPYLFGWGWLGILAVYMILSFVFQRLLVDRSTAFVGLVGMGILEGIIFAPILVIAWAVSGGNFDLIGQALAIAGITFGGLTAYVMLTKQDFSWLRGVLIVGVIVLFAFVILGAFGGLGFSMGLAVSAFGILLFSGFILYDTSQILHHMGPGDEIMAGGRLHVDFAMLLWYVIQFLIHLTATDG